MLIAWGLIYRQMFSPQGCTESVDISYWNIGQEHLKDSVQMSKKFCSVKQRLIIYGQCIIKRMNSVEKLSKSAH